MNTKVCESGADCQRYLLLVSLAMTLVLLANNVVGAKRERFVDSEKADLRLRSRGVKAVDAALPVPGLERDLNRRPRTSGPRPDAGAFEYQVQ